jgi:hypothetical protein
LSSKLTKTSSFVLLKESGQELRRELTTAGLD